VGRFEWKQHDLLYVFLGKQTASPKTQDKINLRALLAGSAGLRERNDSAHGGMVLTEDYTDVVYASRGIIQMLGLPVAQKETLVPRKNYSHQLFWRLNTFCLYFCLLYYC
jgi:hypothetical protein